ncbi:MAG: NADH-quinone oxidoreductase subunit NuoF [Armatimonadetes bacterium]|nr:NADH-quinone oxidoreductase subunit NuoF [Armatimonadota bacterium]
MPDFQPVLLKNRYVDRIWDIDVYESRGGYAAVRKGLKTMSPDQVTEEVGKAQLRGRGGAGFPAARKWGFIPKDLSIPRYVVMNSDESEPGTYKDRQLLEWDPHQCIEAMILSSYAIQAKLSFIFLRGEFVLAAERLEYAIQQAYRKGYLGKNILGTGWDFDLHIHRGAGAYICGEETSLLEALEGHRGQPRLRPPYFPAAKGLYYDPTVVNNCETLCCVPHIVERGADWFESIGTDKSKGPKLYCISGHVQKPDIYEAPFGITLRQLIDDYAGGMRPGRTLRAVIPGGASAPILGPDCLDMTLDFEGVAAAGSMLGSAAVIIMDDTTCMVGAALNLIHFFRHESCGKCTPCREGTDWLFKLLRRIEAGHGREEDLETLLKLCDNMDGKCFCLLGESALVPVRTSVLKFREDYERHIREHRCPYDLRLSH